MNAKFVLALAGVIFCFTHADAKKAMKEVVWPAEEIQFKDMGAEKGMTTGGVSQAVLWGDPEKGAHASLVKFAPGTKHPLHSHSATVKVVVISGTLLYAPENGAEKKLGPGSYLMVPGNMKHTSGCEATECLFFSEASGKWDRKTVETKSAATHTTASETN